MKIPNYVTEWTDSNVRNVTGQIPNEAPLHEWV